MEDYSHYLPAGIRQYIVAEVEHGLPYGDIVDEVQEKYHRSISKGTITNNYSKYKEHGTVFDLPKSGRPRKLSKDEEKKLVKRVEKNPNLTANAIARDPKLNLCNVSSRTITRILNNHGLFDATGIPKVVPDRIMETRLRLALEWQKEKLDWSKVVFSDESDLFPGSQGKVHYRKHRGELVDIEARPQERHDSRKVKVWGAISAFVVGPIIRYDGTMLSTDYVTVLEVKLLSSFPFLRGTKSRESQYYFQQDGAGVHRGGVVEQYFQANHIRKLEWPAYSPDLTLIENVWGFIKGELYKKNDELKTPEETWKEIKNIWYNKVNSIIGSLYKSMPNRIEKVIELNGHRINY